MFFIGFYFLFAKVPPRSTFDNYLRSRRIMGVAVLLLSFNYMAHFVFKIRFFNPDAAVLLNISTYFLCYWLFSTALNILLKHGYLTRKNLFANIGSWLVFSALACIILFFLPQGRTEIIALYILSGLLLIYGLILSRGLLKAYHTAIQTFGETQADDIGNYIHWLSIFTYWAIIFGIGCSLLTFLPDKYIPVWILSSVPFYVYLFCCYQNYLLFYEQVEKAITSEELESSICTPNEKPAYHNELAKRISDDYRKKENAPCLIGLLKGSFIFIADLSRYIDIPIEIDFMIVSSYGNNQIGSEIKILKDIDVQLSGRDVIIVEDIIDTGYTLEKICEVLQTRNIASLKICALLNKPSRRKVNINIDYNGFDIEDEFVVGYGIDYAQKYRNIPYIGVVS